MKRSSLVPLENREKAFDTKKFMVAKLPFFSYMAWWPRKVYGGQPGCCCIRFQNFW